jgi:hypothetical protein
MENTYLTIKNIKDVVNQYIGLKLEESEDKYTIRYNTKSDNNSVITNKQIIVKINRYGIGDRLYTIEHKIIYDVIKNGGMSKMVDRDDIHMLNAKEIRDRESVIGYFRN